jgi:hypothetical protein
MPATSTGSFDCVLARFADDRFVQGDKADELCQTAPHRMMRTTFRNYL